MTTQTLSHSATITNPKASPVKCIGVAAYRLLEWMTEQAYRQHEARLRNNFYI